MKICMISNGDKELLFLKPTGGIKRFLELHTYLKSAGHEVDLVCNCSEEELEQYGLLGYSLSNTTRKKGLLSVSSLNIYLNNQSLYRKLKDLHYDCVIAFDVPTTISACLAGLPNINFFVRQDLIAYRRIQYKAKKMSSTSRSLRLSIGWLMEAICIYSSKRIVSQCVADIEAIKSRHPLLRRAIDKKSRIQINNINPSWIENCGKVTKGEESEKYDIVFVGNFDDERKGYNELLQALRLLSQRGKDYCAVMIGGGNRLKDYVEAYSDSKSISFVGWVSNPSTYIVNSRLMVVPSHSDSCPNTIMEALYYRVPVIGANRGGIPEILNNRDWLFDLSAGSLAQKISDIFTNDKLSSIAKAQESRRQELTFNWGKAIERLLYFGTEDTH